MVWISTFNQSPVVGYLDYVHFFIVMSSAVVGILINSSLLISMNPLR